jgi:antitoxin MazE
MNKIIIMQTNIIRIGNSKGLRLSKTLLQQYNIKDAVELILEKDHIKIRPIKTPRAGWSTKLKQMHENGDDQLLIDDVFEDEVFEE